MVPIRWGTISASDSARARVALTSYSRSKSRRCWSIWSSRPAERTASRSNSSPTSAVAAATTATVSTGARTSGMASAAPRLNATKEMAPMMRTVTRAWAHQARSNPETAAIPNRIGWAVAVSSGMTARAVIPTMSPVSHPVAIQGAAAVAMIRSHRAAVDTTSRAASPAIGIQNCGSANTLSLTACAEMMIITTQATAEARRSRDARKRAIALWVVGFSSSMSLDSSGFDCILGISPGLDRGLIGGVARFRGRGTVRRCDRLRSSPGDRPPWLGSPRCRLSLHSRRARRPRGGSAGVRGLTATPGSDGGGGLCRLRWQGSSRASKGHPFSSDTPSGVGSRYASPPDTRIGSGRWC